MCQLQARRNLLIHQAIAGAAVASPCTLSYMRDRYRTVAVAACMRAWLRAGGTGGCAGRQAGMRTDHAWNDLRASSYRQREGGAWVCVRWLHVAGRVTAATSSAQSGCIATTRADAPLFASSRLRANLACLTHCCGGSRKARGT